MGKIETNISVYRLQNLLDEGVLPCPTTSNLWFSYNVLWSSMSNPLGNTLCLCLHFAPKSHTLAVSTKCEQYVSFIPEGKRMFLPVVLMIDPGTLSPAPLSTSRSFCRHHFWLLPHVHHLRLCYFHCDCCSLFGCHRHYPFYV